MSIRIVFTAREVQKKPDLPPLAIDKASKKVAQLMEDGTIQGYVSYYDSAAHAWQDLHEEPMPPNTVLSLQLVACYPFMRGIEVRKPMFGGMRGVAAQLTIDTKADVCKKWYPEWLIRFVRDQGKTKGPIDTTAISSALFLAQAGKRSEDLEIPPLDKLDYALEVQVFAGYTLHYYDEPARIVLEVEHIQMLRDETAFRAMLGQVRRFAQKAGNRSRRKIQILTDYITRAASFSFINTQDFHKTQSVRYLAAIEGDGALAVTEEKEEAVELVLTFQVSGDAMTATIADFNKALYSDHTIDREWLGKQARAFGLEPGEKLEFITTEIAEKALKGEDLTGMVVMKGIEPVPGEGPKIDLSPATITQTGEIQQLAFRPFVKKGEVAAQIGYESPCQIGRDVWGRQLLVTHKEVPNLQVDETIEIDMRLGLFYARRDGLPKYENNVLKVEKSILYDGDIDATSGDVDVDGNLVVRGSIRENTRVKATGDVLVRRNLGCESFECGGSLRVGAGINAAGGRFIIGGEFSAKFAMGATIEVKGDVKISQGLIGSTVVTSEGVFIGDAYSVDVDIDPPSSEAEGEEEEGGSEGDGEGAGLGIYGGRVICKNDLITDNIGTDTGNLTTVIAGVNGLQMMAVEKLQDEITQLTSDLEESRKQLEFLRRRTDAEMSKKRKTLKEELNATIEQADQKIAANNARIAELNEILEYRDETIITINGRLSSNTILQISKTKIEFEDNYEGVKVAAKARKGTHFKSL